MDNSSSSLAINDVSDWIYSLISFLIMILMMYKDGVMVTSKFTINDVSYG